MEVLHGAFYGEIMGIERLAGSVSGISRNAFVPAVSGRAGSALEKSPPEDKAKEQENKVIRELQKTDAQVRLHEMAHKNAAGPYAGPIKFDTVQGPDGKSYAVGGSVEIDVSPEATPEETVRKMAIVKQAAMAPSDPSAADHAVAAQAEANAMAAKIEMTQENPSDEKLPEIMAYEKAQSLSSPAAESAFRLSA